MISQWRKEVSKCLQRLHYKTQWTNYYDGDTSYADFKAYIFETVNAIRKQMGDKPYSYEKFDEGWQYREVCHEDYKKAYQELLDLIFGWW